MKVGILGGGLTGLTLGNMLKCDFEILEANKECGGLCRSLQQDGYTFDYGGSHVIFSKDKKVLDFMVSVLGNNSVKVKRNTKIFYKGRFVKYPFENGLSDLPKEENYECLLGFVKNLLERKGKPKNFNEWCYYMFGKGIAEKYLIPYNEKIWNWKTEKMGIEWVERVPMPPVEDVIKSSLGIETEGYVHQLYFYYPKLGGIQALVASLESNVANRVTKDFKIKSVKKDGDVWTVSDGRVEKNYDRIVSTIPLTEFAGMLGDVPLAVADAAENLRCNSLIIVMIGVDKPELNGISWLYFPEKKDGKFCRVSFPFNYSARVAPLGKSSLLAEITCAYGGDTWNMPDEEISESVINDLHKDGIMDRKNVCFTAVKRNRYAYIIHDLDYSKNVKTVRDYMHSIGIELCGRFAEFEYLNMDACVRRAMDTAKIINDVAV